MTKDSLLEWRYRDKNPLLTYTHLYRSNWRHLLMAIFYFVIKHSGVWAMPLLMANLIDIAANPSDHNLTEFWIYIGILVVIFAQNIPTNYLFIRSVSTATRNVESQLRAALARRFQMLSMNFYQNNSTGALQTKILRDVEILQTLTLQLFQTVPAAVVTLVFAIVVTAARVPEFLLFYLLTIPSSVFLVRVMRSPLAERNHDFRVEVQNMSARLIEMINLIPVTRAHGVEEEELERVSQKLEQVRNSGTRLDLVNALFGASAWVTFNLFEVLCLAFAVYGAYTQVVPITVGEVVMLTGFFRNLTNSVLAITNIAPEISKGIESIHSLGEVLESPDLEQNQGKAKVKNVDGHFQFEQVSFAYPDTGETAIDAISLEVHPHETIAFVGPSGAGKSTLTNLIIGFLRPTSGRILLDGRDMAELDLRTYRRYLSVVPQHTVLFDGTIRENILYGVKNPDPVQLEQVLKFSNAYEFIEELPKGLDTMLGENGARLSGGQRQRISIARALIRDPRILILDEATSALDTQSEALIQQALNHLIANRTTFVVAHRLSTIERADRIVVMDQGRIVEIGTHKSLIRKKGLYAQMHHPEVQALP